MDAIKYVSALILALIVISVAVGVVYAISGSFQTETNKSGHQNVGLLDCVQKPDMSWSQCRSQNRESSFEPDQSLEVRKAPV